MDWKAYYYFHRKRILTSVFLLLIVVLILIKIGLPTDPCGKKYKGEVQIAGNTFDVEIADIECKMVRGLSYRKILGENEGMIFVFPKTDYHAFWMKDMLFPIDIVWIDEKYEVVGIEKDVRPESYPQVYGKNFLSKYVIELNSGTVEKMFLKVGNKIFFSEK